MMTRHNRGGSLEEKISERDQIRVFEEGFGFVKDLKRSTLALMERRGVND